MTPRLIARRCQPLARSLGPSPRRPVPAATLPRRPSATSSSSFSSNSLALAFGGSPLAAGLLIASTEESRHRHRVESGKSAELAVAGIPFRTHHFVGSKLLSAQGASA